MEIRWIEAFITVAEELHFGRAADRMHMAQSPLSQTIKKLERHLGAVLFERNTRSVALTSAGHAFLPHAKRVVREIDLAHRATRSLEGEVYGRVTIGFSGALNHRTLPPLTRALRARYPRIDLRLVDRVVTHDAMQLLHQGRIDLAFVGMPLAEDGMEVRAISEEAFGAVLPTDHPLAGEESIDLADLAGEDFIMLPPQAVSRELVVSACLDAGFRPRQGQEVVDPYLILSFVAAGLGVSLAPSCLSLIMPEGSVFRPLRGKAPRLRSGIAWNPEHPTEGLRALLSVADDVLPTP